MEMNRLTREADELIRKVVARYNSLYSTNGTLSQVELDLLLDEIRQMYEKFKTLGLVSLQHQQQESRKISIPAPHTPEHQNEYTSPSKSSEAGTEKVIRHILETETEESNEPVEDSALIAEELETPEPEPEAEKEADKEVEIAATAISQPPIEERPAPAVSSNDNEEPFQTIADKYKNGQKSFSEMMSSGAGNDASVGSRLGHQAVSDLKSVIGLAEKFSFVNELFGGDPTAYDKAINQLNGAARLAEAEAYLGTLRLNHKWPAESPQAVLLADIIRRKFGA
jgi:hypothetical protein